MGRGTRRRGDAQLLRAGAWALAALLLAAGPALPAPPPPIAPRIVLQAAPSGGVEVAAWTPDDRYIVTATGATHSLTIWEAATGIMIDHARLPVGSGAASGEHLRLNAMEISPDGAKATIHGVAAIFATDLPVQSRAFEVDLRTRRVRTLPPRPLGPAEAGLAPVEARMHALSVIYEDDSPAAAIAKAEASLPPLPASHDGRTTLRRDYWGLVLTTGKAAPRTLRAKEAQGIAGAALDPAGEQLAIVLDAKDIEKDHLTTTIERFNLMTAAYDRPVQLGGDFDAVRWLDADRLLASPETQDVDRDSAAPEDRGAPSPSVVFDLQKGRITQQIPPKCYLQPLDAESLIGAELANCRAGVGGGHGLAVFNLARKAWRPLPLPDAQGRLINYLAVAPSGPAAAVLLVGASGEEVLVFDRRTGATLRALPMALKTAVTGLGFGADGRTVVITVNGALYVWRPGDAALTAMAGKPVVPEMMVADRGLMAISGSIDETILIANLQGGRAPPPLDFPMAVAGGFLPGKPVFWAVSKFNGLRLWDTRDWSAMLTTYLFEDESYLAVAPDGRYDTDLGPDAAQFRWIVPDAPFRSLAPQTFMRDYYEPRLTQRLVDCHTAGDCTATLKPLPAVSTLNRVLPAVRIARITRGASAAEAIVDVEVREGVDAAAANRKTRSGAYNLRLFRNDGLVGQWPAPPPNDVALALPAWRLQNRLKPDADGVSRAQFRVRLPTAAGTETSTFSAYAFNEDRVKSESAVGRFTREKLAPGPARLFVLTVGVDAYDDPRLLLRFAASDARLIGDRLATVRGYDIRRVTLAGEARPGGPPRRVTRAVIEAAFALLAGRDRQTQLARLAEAGVDGSPLDRTTPDDTIIISFAGHGWADPRGAFYLVPADGRWPAAGDPDTRSLISAADLTDWLRPIEFAEMALIIDACHSAASVDAGGYKPGPMGDPGLGQLAYDKGIRILAATQADDVALEDPGLRQGLLTYALAGEGIQAKGGQADLDRNGAITLDEWLGYATKRLPALSQDVRLGRFAAATPGGARGFGKIDTPAARPKPQEPSLFDFTTYESELVLRRTK